MITKNLIQAPKTDLKSKICVQKKNIYKYLWSQFYRHLRGVRNNDCWCFESTLVNNVTEIKSWGFYFPSLVNIVTEIKSWCFYSRSFRNLFFLGRFVVLVKSFIFRIILDIKLIELFGYSLLWSSLWNNWFR